MPDFTELRREELAPDVYAVECPGEDVEAFFDCIERAESEETGPRLAALRDLAALCVRHADGSRYPAEEVRGWPVRSVQAIAAAVIRVNDTDEPAAGN